MESLGLDNYAPTSSGVALSEVASQDKWKSNVKHKQFTFSIGPDGNIVVVACGQKPGFVPTKTVTSNTVTRLVKVVRKTDPAFLTIGGYAITDTRTSTWTNPDCSALYSAGLISCYESSNSSVSLSETSSANEKSISIKNCSYTTLVAESQTKFYLVAGTTSYFMGESLLEYSLPSNTLDEHCSNTAVYTAPTITVTPHFKNYCDFNSGTWLGGDPGYGDEPINCGAITTKGVDLNRPVAISKTYNAGQDALYAPPTVTGADSHDISVGNIDVVYGGTQQSGRWVLNLGMTQNEALNSGPRSSLAFSSGIWAGAIRSYWATSIAPGTYPGTATVPITVTATLKYGVS